MGEKSLTETFCSARHALRRIVSGDRRIEFRCGLQAAGRHLWAARVPLGFRLRRAVRSEKYVLSEKKDVF